MDKNLIEALEITGVIVIGVVSVGWMFWTLGYRWGQIDALSDKQKYRLIEFPDGVREYYKNPKPKHFTGDYKNFKVIK